MSDYDKVHTPRHQGTARIQIIEFGVKAGRLEISRSPDLFLVHVHLPHSVRVSIQRDALWFFGASCADVTKLVRKRCG